LTGYNEICVGKEAFKGDTTIKTLILEEGVTHILLDSFNGCAALTSVTVPTTLTSITSSSFNGT